MNIIRTLVPVCVLLLWLCLPGTSATAPGEESYPAVSGPCLLRFPDDHGAHPDFQTEWWYYTGNLRSSDGKPFGFQLTFFRRRLIPPGDEATLAEPASKWRTSQVYLAHAAVSDITGKTFRHAERMSRGTLGFAGTLDSPGTRTVFLGNWSAELGAERHRLRADTGEFSIDLDLRPGKPPVLHGQSGYSRKGRRPESASCYYSFTRLEAEGSIGLEGKSVSVQGMAWMDHEFSSVALESDLEGWDWFSLQLSDGTELMIYLLREKGGPVSAASSGTLVERSGSTIHIESTDMEAQVTDYWTSPETGARYPQKWSFRIRSPDMEFTVVSNLPNQEMRTPGTTGVTYWEGSVTARGTRAGTSFEAKGYMELTGYDKPMAGVF